MKRFINAFLLLLAIALLVAAILFAMNRTQAVKVQKDIAAGRRVRFTGPPPPFCVCHSKSTGMRKMHRSFGLSDCAICHRDSNVMKRDRPKPTAKQLEHTLATTVVCLQCHKHPR